MSDLTTLQTIKANYLARLSEASASPKLTYSIDGQSFSWTEYQQFLFDSLTKVDQQIAAAQGGFFEISQAFS